MNVIMPPMQQQKEPTQAMIVGTAWELSRTLFTLKTEDVKAVVPGAKAQQLDAVAIETLELLVGVLELFDNIGLRKRMESRRQFFEKPLASNQQP